MEILKYLNKNDIQQKELARILGVTPAAVNKYIKGKTEPNIKTLLKMSEIFKCSLDELIGNEKKENNNLPEYTELLKTISNLTEIECHKLNVFAQGLIINRNFEQQGKINKKIDLIKKGK